MLDDLGALAVRILPLGSPERSPRDFGMNFLDLAVDNATRNAY